jgi:hypothetical protein
MNIEFAKSVHEMNQQCQVIRHAAVVSYDTLVADCEQTLDRLNRLGVQSPKARALHAIGLHAFESAKGLQFRVERANSLKAVSSWLGMIEMNWI